MPEIRDDLVERTLDILAPLIDTPADGLATISWLRQELDRMERDFVTEMREDGASWADVGEALGVTREAAWQRYGKT